MAETTGPTMWGKDVARDLAATVSLKSYRRVLSEFAAGIVHESVDVAEDMRHALRRALDNAEGDRREA